jgi:hypothetical protein
MLKRNARSGPHARWLGACVLLLGLLFPAYPSLADDAPAAVDPAVKAFVAQFQAAMQANDKDKIAALIAFPVDLWTVEGSKGVENEQKIKDRAAFLAKYSKLVTPAMRNNVAKGKINPSTNGHYYLVWDDQDNEFAFEIGRQGADYKITSYLVGPY